MTKFFLVLITFLVALFIELLISLLIEVPYWSSESRLFLLVIELGIGLLCAAEVDDAIPTKLPA
jgi:hypothetical protein